MPLKHPVNVAYEAATADLSDVNQIDSFHLSEYNITAVNYNRDLETFPILKAILSRITSTNVYKSPTDMGVNMIGNCIKDEGIVSFFGTVEEAFNNKSNERLNDFLNIMLKDVVDTVCLGIY